MLSPHSTEVSRASEEDAEPSWYACTLWVPLLDENLEQERDSGS